MMVLLINEAKNIVVLVWSSFMNSPVSLNELPWVIYVLKSSELQKFNFCATFFN